MASIFSKSTPESPRVIYGVVKKNLNFPHVGMHRRIEIVLVTDGELVMRVNRDTRSVQAGYAVFLDSYDAHSFRTDHISTCAIIEFFPEFCREVYAPF